MQAGRRDACGTILGPDRLTELTQLEEKRVELSGSFVIHTRQGLVEYCIHIATYAHEEIPREHNILRPSLEKTICLKLN